MTTEDALSTSEGRDALITYLDSSRIFYSSHAEIVVGPIVALRPMCSYVFAVCRVLPTRNPCHRSLKLVRTTSVAL